MMNETNGRLPLFDIDGTLLRGGNPLHHHAFHVGFKKVFGFEGTIDKLEVAGMLDRQIIKAILEYHNYPLNDTEEKMQAMFREMSSYFRENARDMSSFLLPGVKETLELLKLHNIPAGLLTGNVEEIAWSKMEWTGILPYFQRFGGFGDAPVEIRAELIPIAVKRANRLTGKNYTNEDVVIIGDTVRDIECARLKGARVAAVCTGGSKREDLAAMNPDLLMESLEEGEKLMEWLRTETIEKPSN